MLRLWRLPVKGRSALARLLQMPEVDMATALRWNTVTRIPGRTFRYQDAADAGSDGASDRSWEVVPVRQSEVSFQPLIRTRVQMPITDDDPRATSLPPGVLCMTSGNLAFQQPTEDRLKSQNSTKTNFYRGRGVISRVWLPSLRTA